MPGEQQRLVVAPPDAEERLLNPQSDRRTAGDEVEELRPLLSSDDPPLRKAKLLEKGQE